MTKLTDAGRKMLQRYLDAEAQGRLVTLRDGSGREFGGIELETGNGAQRATAEKLSREGLAGMQWSRSLGNNRGRYLWITDVGRAAMGLSRQGPEISARGEEMITTSSSVSSDPMPQVSEILTKGDDDRVFIDDGTYYIQANINGDRADTNGFLHRRCSASMTTPGGYDCPGGYQLDPRDGKWKADVHVGWDDDEQTDCKVLGSFATRNEAIAALWAHRHEAVPHARQPNRSDVMIEAAWREAQALAEAKGDVAYGAMSEGKQFGGKILMANVHVVVQNLGRGAVIHNAQGLERIPQVDESVTVKYDANGRGAVSPRERTGQERMRGGR